MLFSLKTFIADANILGEIREIGWSETDQRLSISGINYDDAAKIVSRLADPIKGWSGKGLQELHQRDEAAPSNGHGTDVPLTDPAAVAAGTAVVAERIFAAAETLASEPDEIFPPANEAPEDEPAESVPASVSEPAPADALGDLTAFSSFVYLQDVVKELQRRGYGQYAGLKDAVVKLRDTGACTLLTRIRPVDFDTRLVAACKRLSVGGTP